MVGLMVAAGERPSLAKEALADGAERNSSALRKRTGTRKANRRAALQRHKIADRGRRVGRAVFSLPSSGAHSDSAQITSGKPAVIALKSNRSLVDELIENAQSYRLLGGLLPGGGLTANGAVLWTAPPRGAIPRMELEIQPSFSSVTAALKGKF